MSWSFIKKTQFIKLLTLIVIFFMTLIKSLSLTSTFEIDFSTRNFIAFNKLMRCSLTFFFYNRFHFFHQRCHSFHFVICLSRFDNDASRFNQLQNLFYQIFEAHFVFVIFFNEQRITSFSLNFSSNLWRNQTLRNVFWSFLVLINFSKITIYWRQYWKISFRNVRILFLKISRYFSKCNCWLRFLFL